MAADTVIVAAPILTPVMLGGVVGEVAPVGITTVAGTVAIAVLLLLSAIVTPPAGAAGEMEIESGAVRPNPGVAGFDVIVPSGLTVTFAVTFPILGSEDAVIVADPGATPVTAKVAVVPVAIVTVAGTAAAAVLLELRLIVTPPAGTDAPSVRVSVAVLVPIIVALVGESAAVVFTKIGREEEA